MIRPRKESGSRWIGCIPEEWKILPLGRIFEERREATTAIDAAPLSVTKKGVVDQLNDVAVSVDGAPKKLVREGDLVINSRSDRKGSSGLAPRDGSVSVINIVLHSVGIDPKYAHHLIRSSAFQEEFYRFGSGIVADLWSTRWTEMKSIAMPVPPSEEQMLIADYLDREIDEIDDILVEHKLLRDLLFERRTEVITTATRSSNPELREAPLVRLRHVAGLNPSPRMNIASNSDQVFPLYNMDSISEFGSLRPPVLRPYSELANGYSYLEPTDVAYAKVTPCFENGKGLVGTELDGPSFATTELTVFRPSPELDQNYLALVLQSADFHAVGEASMTGAGGLKRVSETAARNYRFPLPDKKTQTRIVEKVRFEVDSTNALISDSSRLSDLLTERRAALISAAVTGQIDVSAHDESGPEQFRNDLEANV
ncbi:hypothetical protein ACTXJJ_06165 [Corynebacterium casei]|uniref:hypothetical protein n=1 Tax=Corynebacterium casei TaxID=160386 RepID=UPI003FD046A3